MNLIRRIVPAAVLVIAFSVPVLAQSASDSMHEAGSSCRVADCRGGELAVRVARACDRIAGGGDGAGGLVRGYARHVGL